MPDATGLELLAQELGDAALETVYFRDRATLVVEPAQIRAVLATLRGKGYAFLASVHGVDYYPEEPRLGVDLRAARHEPRRPHHGQAARPQRRARGRLGDARTGRRPTTRSARSTTCSASSSRAIPTCGGS